MAARLRTASAAAHSANVVAAMLLRAPLGHPAFSAPPGSDLLLLPLLLVAGLGVATGCATALHGATAAAAAGDRGRRHWLLQAYLKGPRAGAEVRYCVSHRICRR